MSKDRLHRLTSQEVLNAEGPGLGWTPLQGESILDVTGDRISVDVTGYSKIMIGLKQQWTGYGYIQFTFTELPQVAGTANDLDGHHELYLYAKYSPYTIDVPKLSGGDVYLTMKTTSNNFDISVWVVGL